MNKKIFSGTIFIIIVGFAGYYFYTNKSAKEPKQLSPAPTALPTPIVAPTPVVVKTPVKKAVIPATIPVVNISDLVNNPNKFYKQKIQVTGKLIDTGKNYYTSPNFIITDGINNFPVNMWAPIATYGKEPTMHDYLNKIVTLEASVELNGNQFYLYIYNAKQ